MVLFDLILYFIDILMVFSLFLNGRHYAPEFLHGSTRTFIPGERGVRYHSHPVYHILIYDRGRGELRLEEDRIAVENGGVLFVSPMARHQFLGGIAGYRYAEVTFALVDGKGGPCLVSFQELFRSLGYPLPAASYFKPEKAVFARLRRRILAFTGIGVQPPRGRREKTELWTRLFSFLGEIGSALAGSVAAGAGKGGKVLHGLEPVLDHINARFTGKISLSGLAGMAGCSREHLCRRFKKVTGVNLTDYVTRLRLELAEKLLTTAGLPIKVACVRAGFEDVYYFSRVFKKRYGLPPARYRRALSGTAS